jgi:hypothetical protein
MEYKALLTEKGEYSFDKAYLGSYKHFVPDHYKLGYLMVGKGREKYGTALWENSVLKAGRQPYSLTPMNSSVKKETGLTTKGLYLQIADELTKEWNADLKKSRKDSVSIVSPVRKSFTEYLYPHFYNDSLIFAYRTSIDDIGRFVLIDMNRTEKIIFTPGIIFEESVSMQKNLIIWAERRSDIRWTHADRSVIQLLDIETNKRKEIKNKNKLFSPAISPDLKSFAAVEVDPANNFSLSVFDINSGDLKFQFKTADNQYFFTPCWDEKGEKLIAVCLSAKGKFLASFDLKSLHIEPLTEPTFANIRNPECTNGKVIFSSDFDGTDNIYLLNLSNKRIFSVASVRYGADYPSISGNKIVFSNYSSSGYQLATVYNDKSNVTAEITGLQLKPNHLAETLASHETGILNLTKADSITFPSKKYSKLGHLFNFHSWAPAYVDVNSYEIKPGASFFSQNKLGTAETRLGYEYDVTEKTGRYKIGFAYLGLFPEINTELSFGNQASNYYLIKNTLNKYNQVISSDTTVERYTWSELTADLDIRLPLNFSRGKHSRIFYPEVKYTFNQVSLGNSAPDNFYSGNYHALTYRLYLYNLLQQSQQNIMPRWGQQFDVVYRHTPFVGNDLGSLAGIQSAFYFPGIARNHGMKIYAGYQEKIFKKNYNFSNFIRFPRGFLGYQNNQMFSFSADYKFPLLYPDVSLGKLAYIKRIKTSLFYDYTWLSIPVTDKNGIIYPNDHEMELKSFGIELTSDLHLLRFFAPLEIGFRTVYRPDYQDLTLNLLLSIDFNGF